MGAFREFFKGLFENYVAKGINTIVERISDGVIAKSKEWAIWRLDRANNVRELDTIFSMLPSGMQEDEEVKKYYASEKKTMEDTGMLTSADVALSFLGKQMAGAIWWVTETAMPKVMEWIDTFGEAYGMEMQEREALKKLAKSGEFGLNAVVSFMLGVTIYPAVMSASAPVWEKAAQAASAKMRPTLLPPELLIRAKWRGIIPADYVNETMAKAGYTDEDIQRFEDTLKFYPTPADLVTWQAREVYEPEMIAKYGLDDEFEAVEKEPFHKAGMDDIQIRNFWRAHWVHPAWTTIRDMLYRGEITEEDVWEWFKTVEIPPFWREKYIATAYSPIARVDLRRLYQLGVIDREKVKAGYIALGNKPEDAEWLTQWTEIEYAPPDRELTKTEILKNYRIGKVEKDEVRRLLAALEYDEAEIEWILTYEDYTITMEEVEAEAETVISELVGGIIDLKQAGEKLDMLKLPIKAKNKYLKKAEQEYRKMLQMPSKDDVKRWFTLKIITEEDFRARMRLLKYSDADIDNYVKEVAKK